ncbi:Sun domain-containing protein [Thalictrum thalictroides]|uniref:Sun domain-containing protein n=1 Tax=Thalictrum thalictroides TaxID=46969 RepID=A0A7J6WMS4_THATH|nr:Sun domain-containing protein [Thalictrum thalictroides]
MSTSTVSISANPNNPAVLSLGASTRRRNVEKKTSNFEMVSSEGGNAGGVGVGVSDQHQIQLQQQVSSDKSTKDLLPSSLHQVNKKSPTTVYTRRTTTKKAIPNPPEKARWQTVLSVFTKNFLLVIILLGLVQLIRTLTLGSSGFDNNSKSGLLSVNGISEIEGRIGEIDALLKETNKMVQVQLDVVDKKIENEVGGVKRDLMKKIEEKGEFFENRLKKLEDRSDGLEQSLSQLKSSKLLTNEDLRKFSEELKNSRNSQGIEGPVSLDDIGAVARSIVEKAIEKHAADGLGRVDYALASGGAMVVAHSEQLLPTAVDWLRIKRINVAAQKMLLPSFGEPGHCFPLKGSNGFVEIKLRRDIIPDAVTLEHVAKSVAYDRSSAPKDCQIFGWFHGLDADQSSQAEKKFLLTEFAYDLERSNAQTFNVESSNSGIVNRIRFEFSSNHGGPHTCIYRLRVHGHEPDLVAVPS